MTQEEKDLLLKDLCARLPYEVKLGFYASATKQTYICTLLGLEPQEDEPVIAKTENGSFYMLAGNVKPFLFPLSSMTEEQKKEISKRYNYHNPYQLCVEITNHREGYWDNDNSCNLQDYLWLEDWLNENNFDYRGLIPKGLAIDATGLNIY